jgi:hypothetical protein
MNPTAGDVHVNTPLTNISIAYLQSADNFVATKVFPNIPVTKQSDRYYTYDRGEFNRDEAEERAPGTESAGGSYSLDNTPTYFCKVYAFHKDVPDQIRGNADAVLNLDNEATEYVTHKALIKREKRFVANYFTDGIWTVDIEGVASGPTGDQVLYWSLDTGDPIKDIRTGKTNRLQDTGFEPNTLIMGKAVWDAVIDHPDVVDRIKYGQTPGNPAIANIEALMKLFEIERIFVMKAIENTAKEGATNVHAFIGGKHALLCYVAPSPGIMTPSAGYTFSWTGWMGAGAEGNRIKRFRIEKLESDRVEVQMSFDQKLVAADCGYFFNGIVA